MISMNHEYWGTFYVLVMKIVVLADSSPFLGLLLTILGSQSNFHGCRTPICAYGVGRQDSQFGPIMALFMDYYSLIWGP